LFIITWSNFAFCYLLMDGWMYEFYLFVCCIFVYFCCVLVCHLSSFSSCFLLLLLLPLFFFPFTHSSCRMIVIALFLLNNENSNVHRMYSVSVWRNLMLWYYHMTVLLRFVSRHLTERIFLNECKLCITCTTLPFKTNFKIYLFGSHNWTV
jgi:predicted membrane protein